MVIKMTNTYGEDAQPSEKIAEELRLIRCIMERKLSEETSQGFLDYQMEKFGKEFKLDNSIKNKADKSWNEDKMLVGFVVIVLSFFISVPLLLQYNISLWWSVIIGLFFSFYILLFYTLFKWEEELDKKKPF